MWVLQAAGQLFSRAAWEAAVGPAVCRKIPGAAKGGEQLWVLQAERQLWVLQAEGQFQVLVPGGQLLVRQPRGHAAMSPASLGIKLLMVGDI